MRRKIGQTSKALLLASTLAFVLPATAAAQTIGGFDTEISKKKKKTSKPKKEDIVYVSTDPRHPGPKSIEEALSHVKEGGEIVVHPGVYDNESLNLKTSVSIRGIRDNRGEAPMVRADGTCMRVSKADVSARVSDLIFAADDATCVSVSGGQLEIVNSELRGKRRDYGYQSAHLRPFSEAAATGARTALVSIKGGRVTVAESRLIGGETGVMVNPGSSSNAYQHVDIRGNTISEMTGAGVVMLGDVDVTLAGNTIVANDMSGVVYNASGHARVVNNIISDNTHNGLYLVGMGDAVSIEGNKIHNNTDDGIEVRSGTAILVGNEIGRHNGCAVNKNAFDRTRSEHLANPPIQLLADAQGVNQYDTRGECSGKKEPERRRGLFRRG